MHSDSFVLCVRPGVDCFAISRAFFWFWARVGASVEHDIERVEQSWDIEDDCQHDADHEFASHSLFESHGEGWEQDRDDDE